MGVIVEAFVASFSTAPDFSAEVQAASIDESDQLTPRVCD